MRYSEKKGHLPFLKAKTLADDELSNDNTSEDVIETAYSDKDPEVRGASTRVRSLGSAEPESPA